MAKEQPPKTVPLTDVEIRCKFDTFSDDIMKLSVNVMAFERLLLKAGFVTEAQIAATIREVTAEMKAAIAKVQDSIRRGPSGTVQ